MLEAELEALAPREEVAADWPDVLRRVRRPPRRRLAPLAIAAALVVAVVAAPTFALSSSVRGLFGLGHRPLLVRAVPVVEAPAGHGLVARLWSSPVGACQFITVSRSAPRRVAQICRVRGSRLRVLRQRLSYTVARRRGGPVAVGGHVALRLHATRVELRWNGGSQRLAFRRGWFLGVVRARPPYTLVAYDAGGRVLARKRVR